jgi:RNA polymerase sigma-B factor
MREDAAGTTMGVPGTTRRPRATTPAERERLILAHLPLVRALARRYANRGEPLDDVIQVGMLGLIKAIDRYDPDRGTDLASFATPTILGEIRRHFRDHTWGMHVPRGLQDAHAAVSRGVESLSVRLGRSPSVAEIAEETGLTEEEVLEGMAAGQAYRPKSLSATPPGQEDADGMDVPEQEPGYEVAEGRASLGQGLRRLQSRERVIMHLRFELGMTQSEIAARVGISQMHVSRLIQRALEELREEAGMTGVGSTSAR